jgi:hypothetical protein
MPSRLPGGDDNRAKNRSDPSKVTVAPRGDYWYLISAIRAPAVGWQFSRVERGLIRERQ